MKFNREFLFLLCAQAERWMAQQGRVSVEAMKDHIVGQVGHVVGA